MVGVLRGIEDCSTKCADFVDMGIFNERGMMDISNLMFFYPLNYPQMIDTPLPLLYLTCMSCSEHVFTYLSLDRCQQ